MVVSEGIFKYEFATEFSIAQRDEFHEIKLNNVLEVTHCNIWNNFQSTCELSVENSTRHFDKPHYIYVTSRDRKLSADSLIVYDCHVKNTTRLGLQ